MNKITHAEDKNFFLGKNWKCSVSLLKFANSYLMPTIVSQKPQERNGG